MFYVMEPSPMIMNWPKSHPMSLQNQKKVQLGEKFKSKWGEPCEFVKNHFPCHFKIGKQVKLGENFKS